MYYDVWSTRSNLNVFKPINVSLCFAKALESEIVMIKLRFSSFRGPIFNVMRTLQGLMKLSFVNEQLFIRIGLLITHNFYKQ